MTTNALVFGSPLNFICVCIKFYLCLCVCIYAGVRVCVGVRPHDLPAYADSTLKHYHAIFQIHQGADPVGCGQQCRWEIWHCGPVLYGMVMQMRPNDTSVCAVRGCLHCASIIRIKIVFDIIDWTLFCYCWKSTSTAGRQSKLLWNNAKKAI